MKPFNHCGCGSHLIWETDSLIIISVVDARASSFVQITGHTRDQSGILNYWSKVLHRSSFFSCTEFLYYIPTLFYLVLESLSPRGWSLPIKYNKAVHWLEHTWRHGSCKDKVGSATTKCVSFMVAAVNINAVKSKRLEMGDDSSLLAIHFGLKEGVFHFALLCIRNIGEVIWPSCVPVPSGQSGICDSEHVPPLPIGSVE